MVFDVFRDRDEDGRWERKVEQTVDIASFIRLLDPFEMFRQIDERFGVLVTTGDIGRELFELFELACDGSIIVWDFDVGSDALVILFSIHFCARIANDVDISGEITITIETEQGGIRLKWISGRCG